MAEKRLLILRLDQQPALYELARLIGYQGLPVPEAQEKMKPLSEQYEQEVMAQAAEEIVRIDASTNPPTARLKDSVRPWCWQLLGPPPEHPEYKHFRQAEAWRPSWQRASETTSKPGDGQDPRPQKTRKRKTT